MSFYLKSVVKLNPDNNILNIGYIAIDKLGYCYLANNINEACKFYAIPYKNKIAYVVAGGDWATYWLSVSNNIMFGYKNSICVADNKTSHLWSEINTDDGLVFISGDNNTLIQLNAKFYLYNIENNSKEYVILPFQKVTH